jgi:D-alanyl-D-alanine carboxypeptidase
MNEKALQRSCAYIKDWLMFHYEREDNPGFVVAIAHKGKVLLNEAYGYANLENKQKLTPQHIFRIASHSKTFTATAIMQLQEQGKIKIDDKVTDYVLWLKDHKDERWQNVTIRQLMSHSAGVTRDGPANDYWNVEAPFPSKDEFRAQMLEAELVIDNNTQLKYSNYGYALLGEVIEAVSGSTYHNYVTINIVEQLGLTNTGPEFNESNKGRLVTGYSRKGPGKKRLPIVNINTNSMASATGFYSTAEDLCTYFNAHMQGSGKLLRDESKKEMQRVQWQAENTRDKVDYGLGLDIEYVNEHRLFGHGGGFPGNITKSYFDPKNELVVIALTNANGSPTALMGKSIVKVIDYFQDEPAEPKWVKFQGRYMSLWRDSDYIAIGNKLVVSSSDSWEPFSAPEELEHVEGNLFKISKTDSFSSVNETVEFTLDSSGKVVAVNYAGARVLPEDAYIKKMASQKQIGVK